MTSRDRWKQAKRTAYGSVFEFPRSYRVTGLGCLLVMSVPIFALDRLLFGLDVPPLDWLFQLAVPGWLVLLLGFAAGAHSQIFYRGRRLVDRLPQTPLRRGLARVALSLPCFDWTYCAGLVGVAPQGRASPLRPRWLERYQLSVRSVVVKLSLDVLFASSGALWLTGTVSASWPSWVPPIVLAIASHGAIVFHLQQFLRQMATIPSWLRQAAWIGWLPMPFVLLFVAGLVWLESGGPAEGGFTARVSRDKRSLVELEGEKGLLRPVVWTHRWRLICSYRRFQRLRLLAEGLALGWWLPAVAWPPRWIFVGAVAAGGAATLLGFGISIAETIAEWRAVAVERIRGRSLALWVERLPTLATGLGVGLLVDSGRVDLFGSAILLLSLVGATSMFILWTVWTLSGREIAASQSLVWVLPATLIVTLTVVGLVEAPAGTSEPARAIMRGWLDIARVVVIAGPLVAAYFVPWLLKPLRWGDLWRGATPRHERREIASEIVKALLPLGGMVPPRALIEGQTLRHHGRSP